MAKGSTEGKQFKGISVVNNGTMNGETIEKVEFGSPFTPSCGSYGAYTITMRSGRVFVVWQSMGEVNFNEVVDKT